MTYLQRLQEENVQLKEENQYLLQQITEEQKAFTNWKELSIVFSNALMTTLQKYHIDILQKGE